MAECGTLENHSDGEIQEKSKMVKTKWENFENWMHCICVVTFDLELGQAVEVRQIIL